MSTSPIDRRHFLGSAAATAAFFAIHDLPALAGQNQTAVTPAEPGRPRILSLELLCGAAMSEMKAFYGKTLDLRLLNERADRFTVEAGETMLTFVTSADVVDGRPPFYHFAFNIPENKILQALEWQKARSPLLAIPERNRAAGYPPEVVDYSHWNAHSIFFLDPAGNVVEYIARHDLKNGDTTPFSWADILYASEIAFVVDDVAAAAAAIKDAAIVNQYKGGSDQFTAVGDEHGLLLVMKRGRVIDFTSNAANGVRPYRTQVAVRGPKAATHRLAGYPYELSIEERCSC
jgi:catechol-2,3-dioxygenase